MDPLGDLGGDGVNDSAVGYAGDDDDGRIGGDIFLNADVTVNVKNHQLGNVNSLVLRSRE